MTHCCIVKCLTHAGTTEAFKNIVRQDKDIVRQAKLSQLCRKCLSICLACLSCRMCEEIFLAAVSCRRVIVLRNILNEMNRNEKQKNKSTIFVEENFLIFKLLLKKRFLA